MAILVNSKYEEDPIKIEGARVATTQNIDFSNTQGQVTPQSMSKTRSISNSSEILWLSLLPARMKKIPLEMKVLERLQHLSHCKSIGFFKRSRAANSAVHGQILPNFELIRDLMAVLVT